MTLPSLTPFKLELVHNDKKISFGKRFKGDIGRDILAVKIALGLVKSIENSLESGDQAVSYDPNIPFDRQKWFNCSTGLGMDIRRASTFDRSLEAALSNFQIQNQFLITCYLFEKFGVREIIGESKAYYSEFPLDEYDASIARQIESSIVLFENEFGTLQEATLAVLHGWRPLSTVSNNLYVHDPRKYNNENPVVDIIPEVLANDLLQPDYPQNQQDLEENEIVIPGTLKLGLQEKLDFYAFNVASTANWISINDSFQANTNMRFYSLDYYPVFSGESSLFAAVKQVVSLIGLDSDSSEIMTREERDAAARRLIYPNPFTDPDPFIISGTKIGFYDNTEYFISDLENNVNLPNSDPETIKVLEELALIKVLKHYGKPQVWNFLVSNPDFQEAYFPGIDGMGYLPLHSGKYPSEYTEEQMRNLEVRAVTEGFNLSERFSNQFKKDNFHVLSTSNITNQLSEQNQTDVRYWRLIDDFQGTEPLIKFVEYITPSLRPGETYRALFEVNRAKLEAIQAGETIFENQLEQEASTASPPQEQELACPDQNFSQANRTYQEYKTHAIKRRREIVRKLRNEVLKRSNREQGAEVNLGTYGPFDLNAAFVSATGVDLNSYSDYEFTRKVLSLAPELLEALNVSTFDFDLLEGYIKDQEDRNTEKTSEGDVNNLTMTIEELRYRAELATQDLRKAHEIVLRENITFLQGSAFDAANEASLLESYIGNLIGATGVSEQQWKSTSITIKFQNVFIERPGPENGKIITSLTVGSTRLDSRNLPAQRPRTINYLAFLKQITGGYFDNFGNFLTSFFDDSRGSCKEIGIDFEKHIARALIGKYTSGLKLVPKDEEDSDAFLSWFKENFEDPAHSWWDTAKQNAEGSLRDRFNEKQALRLLGDTCKFVGRGNVFEKFVDKFDLASLMCDYLKCIKLPGFDFKMPNLFLPPPPELPIVGWYSGLLQFLKDQYAQAGLRILCTFIRTIIDKIAFPFCQEQLEQFISAGSSATPIMNKALIDALTNTGITSKNNEKAKDFFDKTANILTPRELCYLLSGKRLDDPTMLMVQKVASSSGLEEDLATFDAIENFYGVIGSYISFDLCENLSQFDTLPNAKNCEDTEDLLLAIRNRLMSADPTLTESEISEALDIAVNNANNQKLALEIFQEEGLSAMTPDFFKLGDPNAVVSEYPEFLKNELQNTAEYMFQGAKTSYYTSLSRYVPAMIAEAPLNLNAYDEGYDAVQTLRFEVALQQLEDLTKQFPPPYDDMSLQTTDASNPGINPPPLPPEEEETFIKLSSQFAALHQLYQVEVINGNLVHKRRIKLPNDITFLQNQLLAVSRQIDYLTTRVHRTSGGKQDRLVRERNLAIANQISIAKKIQSLSGETVEEHIISYDEYIEYLSTVEGADPTKEVPEFELVPFKYDPVTGNPIAAMADEGIFGASGPGVGLDPGAISRLSEQDVDLAEITEEASRYTGLYSLELEYFQPSFNVISVNDTNNWSSILNPAANPGPKILTAKQIIAYHESISGADGSDPGITEVLRATQLLQDRITHLRDKVGEILRSRPSIVGSKLLPGLQKLLNRSTEQRIEAQYDFGSIETEGNITKLSFSTGSVYSPEIIMTEYKAGYDKDRYDIKIVGDIFLNLIPGEEKVFKFCEKIPDNNYVDPRATQVFAKRQILSGMIMDSITSRGFESVNNDELSQQISESFFQRLTEASLEEIIDAASESRLFQTCYADPLDARVSGRRIINKNCISNRFSFGDSSVLNFKEVILDDVVKEIAREQVKPENDPINSDFSKPSPVDLAIQTVALKGFIKMCLIDALLKGGLCFAVWDIEPIIGQEVYIKYLYDHVLSELNESNSLKNNWSFVAERATGIFSKHDALDKIVREEILKLPNFSKQIFNFDQLERNFYNWATDSFIPQFMVSQEKHMYEGSKFNYVIPTQTITGHNHYFREEKPSFMIEHYIRIKGSILEEIYRRLQISPTQRDVARNGLILSLDEFYTATRPQSGEESTWWREYIVNGDSTISQGIRLVVVDSTKEESRFSPRGWDYENEDSRVVDDISNIFIKAYAKQDSGENYLVSQSARERSFRVETDTEVYNSESANPQIQRKVAFAIPLVKVETILDFKDCYSVETFFEQNEFLHRIPFMNDLLYKSRDCSLIIDHIIPFRRFMSITTIFTTSILSAFNDMPSLFDSPKIQLANLVLVTSTAPSKRQDLVGITQDQFEKTILDNFPSDQNDWECFDVPNITKDFWTDFYDQLKKLALKLPSILFRGIASTLDPAYREMKAHYHNCDINNLTWDGIKPAGTVDAKLVNGLYLGKTADDRQRNAQTGTGRYVPLVLGSLSDFGYTASSLAKGDFRLFGRRLEKTVLKLITYAYNGNTPFLDPSFYFKVPCKDFSTRQKWAEYGKYDAGKYGRYGHPISPFTALALSTPQLEGDKRIKEDNCRIVQNPNYCEDIEVDFNVAVEVLDECQFEPDFQAMLPNYGRYVPPPRDALRQSRLSEVDTESFASDEMVQEYGFATADGLTDSQSRLLRRLWDIEHKPGNPVGIETRGELDYAYFQLYYRLFGACRPLNRDSGRYYLSESHEFDAMRHAYLAWVRQVERVRALENERIEIRDALNFQRHGFHAEELFVWPDSFNKPNTEGMDGTLEEFEAWDNVSNDPEIEWYSNDQVGAGAEYRQKYDFPLSSP